MRHYLDLISSQALIICCLLCMHFINYLYILAVSLCCCFYKMSYPVCPFPYRRMYVAVRCFIAKTYITKESVPFLVTLLYEHDHVSTD